eukprot:571376-Prymnesium_polylepis.1
MASSPSTSARTHRARRLPPRRTRPRPRSRRLPSSRSPPSPRKRRPHPAAPPPLSRSMASAACARNSRVSMACASTFASAPCPPSPEPRRRAGPGWLRVCGAPSPVLRHTPSPRACRRSGWLPKDVFVVLLLLALCSPLAPLPVPAPRRRGLSTPRGR